MDDSPRNHPRYKGKSHSHYTRGGGLDRNKRAKWMTHLETILDTKVMHIHIIQGVEV